MCSCANSSQLTVTLFPKKVRLFGGDKWVTQGFTDFKKTVT